MWLLRPKARPLVPPQHVWITRPLTACGRVSIIQARQKRSTEPAVLSGDQAREAINLAPSAVNSNTSSPPKLLITSNRSRSSAQEPLIVSA